MTRRHDLKLVLAGGGTGGHLFPGVAIAEELRAREPGADLTFVGTKRGIEARVLPGLGWPLELIEVSGLKTVGALGAVRGMARLPRALMQARRVLKKLTPDAVIGVGGYASGPIVLMARLAGIPTAVCEQNSIPGLTNKLLGRVARAVFLSFEESRRFFRASKIVMSGNPVRRELVAQAARRDAARRADGKRTCIVCGGSQGAIAVNELASQALITLASEPAPLAIVHQTGERDREATAARYAAANVPAEVHAFITDMAAAYLRADVVVGRAGATTVAELAIAGKPAVFIPYPSAADNHQEINAREMAERGGALMLRQAGLTAEALAGALRPLLADPSKRAAMGAAMKSLGKPGAAAAVVDWCDERRRRRASLAPARGAGDDAACRCQQLQLRHAPRAHVMATMIERFTLSDCAASRCRSRADPAVGDRQRSRRSRLERRHRRRDRVAVVVRDARASFAQLVRRSHARGGDVGSS